MNKLDLKITRKILEVLEKNYISEINLNTIDMKVANAILNSFEDEFLEIKENNKQLSVVDLLGISYIKIDINIIKVVNINNPLMKNLMVGDFVMLPNNTLDNKLNIYNGVDHIPIKILRKDKIIDSELKIPKLKVNTTPFEMHLDENFIYVKLNSFFLDINEFIVKLNSLSGSKTRIVFDLRGNLGGIVDNLNKLLSAFFEIGETMYYVKNNNTINKVISKSLKNINYEDMIILCNESTASCAEIFTYSMQYHKKALVVGKKSFGKRIIQKNFNINNMFNLSVPSYKWFIHNENEILRPSMFSNFENDYCLIENAKKRFNILS